MKGAPSIAVMLGGKPPEEGADLSLSEAKASAKDAGHALADAVQAKDGERIVRAFCALQTLCGHLNELEDAGEDDEAEESAEDEAAEGESGDE